MGGQPFFQRLFEHSKQITPYLAGQLKPLSDSSDNSQIIYIERPSAETIRQLYESLKQSHPEAGSAYWLTRTWTLLCWQPVYIAFISIYACQGLPNLTSIVQHVQERFVSGYQFQSHSYAKGNREELIVQASKELCQLFDYYRSEMNAWVRIRPGFTAHLFADAILGCLIKLSQLAPELPKKYLFKQARLWLNACNLPIRLIHSLKYDEQSKSLSLVRTSCCLVYKCHGRKLCNDCPRACKQSRITSSN
ncbi:siderophore ferric iron reductase [Vibrio sp. S4M6]|uniref:siderophore ferric iron reductase n=1 Tax=Vibrio sinus TaxID=2946865 RepID=UPI002029E6AB|nr:siderophore ferric iron reductase [Vibrio sinus]MCL9780401.1 siderophore ferric iron reductase [Vibrio sinus]